MLLKEIYNSDLSKSEKLLLYVLNEMKDSEGIVKATYQALSMYANSSRNTVVKSLQDLEKRKLIEVKAGKGKASNTYKILRRD